MTSGCETRASHRPSRSATSSADSNRRSGAFANSPSTISCSHAGTSELILRSERGLSLQMRFKTPIVVSARKGERPVHM